LQRFVQRVGIAVDGTDIVKLEQLGAEPQHRLAIFQHVGDAGRRARIVLEHEEIAGAGADEIDAADMRVDIMRRPRTGEHRPELRIAEDQFRRNDSLGNDPALAIDVGQEGVDRLDALDEPVG
jgi:hypothetical protein